VNLQVTIERNPQYAEEFVPQGNLAVISNESQADVAVFK
jgi:hypothetical protein